MFNKKRIVIKKNCLMTFGNTALFTDNIWRNKKNCIMNLYMTMITTHNHTERVARVKNNNKKKIRLADISVVHFFFLKQFEKWSHRSAKRAPVHQIKTIRNSSFTS